MRGVIRGMNMFFISVILTAFYLLVIGISSIAMKILQALILKREHSSYWQDFKKNRWDKKYFESEY